MHEPIALRFIDGALYSFDAKMGRHTLPPGVFIAEHGRSYPPRAPTFLTGRLYTDCSGHLQALVYAAAHDALTSRAVARYFTPFT